MEYLTKLPADPEYVTEATRGYIEKLETLKRRSEEERFALLCIRKALKNGLKLPLGRSLFLHQEWRMPTDNGRGKLDLLALDPALGQLVVIELKGSRDKLTVRDMHGHDAAEQARHYADVLFQNRQELYPFLEDLARITARVWSGPQSMRDVTLDPDRAPRCEVWGPPDYRKEIT